MQIFIQVSFMPFPVINFALTIAHFLFNYLGNILVHVTSSKDSSSKEEGIDEDEDEDCQPQYITYVDAGMVAQLTQRESINYIGLISSIGKFLYYYLSLEILYSCN